jgi:hypothetical protein
MNQSWRPLTVNYKMAEVKCSNKNLLIYTFSMEGWVYSQPVTHHMLWENFNHSTQAIHLLFYFWTRLESISSCFIWSERGINALSLDIRIMLLHFVLASTLPAYLCPCSSETTCMAVLWINQNSAPINQHISDTRVLWLTEKTEFWMVTKESIRLLDQYSLQILSNKLIYRTLALSFYLIWHVYTVLKCRCTVNISCPFDLYIYLHVCCQQFLVHPQTSLTSVQPQCQCQHAWQTVKQLHYYMLKKILQTLTIVCWTHNSTCDEENVIITDQGGDDSNSNEACDSTDT